MGFQKDFKPVLRFIAMSDVHYKDTPSVERERMSAALRLGYELCDKSEAYKSLDALYVVGDFTDRGTEEQMNAFNNSLGGVRDGTEITVSLASHEFNSGESVALERFGRIFGMEPDTHKVINGFHFISVTTTNGCHFSADKIEWARKQLEAAAQDDPNKPIFFFQHPHISDTVYGSINWGEDELYATLMNYPQVIDFSGHSHAPINDPRSIHQRHFTSLGTGSLSYFELDEFDKYYGTVPPKSNNCAQMLFVEADAESRVRVYPYDILTESFFPFIWNIDKPSEPESFIYTDKRYINCDFAPYFEKDATLSFDDIDSDGIELSFKQAKCDREYVNSYKVTVKRCSDNRIIRQASFWSCYYFADMPERMTYTITDLEPDTEYCITVSAEGFWFNASSTKLTGSVKTKKE